MAKEIGDSVFFDCGLVFYKGFINTYKGMWWTTAIRKLRKTFGRRAAREVFKYLQEKNVLKVL